MKNKQDTHSYLSTQLTLIQTATDKTLSKRYYVNESGAVEYKAYQNETFFKTHTITIDGIEDFWNEFKEISKESNCAIIRGVIPEDQPSVRRNTETFQDKPLCWVQLDVDEFELPTEISPITVEGIEYFIANELPKEFTKVSYFYQFSNSAGIPQPNGDFLKKGLNVHLYFYLNRPTNNDELKDWVGHIVDDSLFNCVQIHYTALPDIGDGVTCEIETRQDFVKKRKVVVEVPNLKKQVKATQSTTSTWKTDIDDVKKQEIYELLKILASNDHFRDWSTWILLGSALKSNGYSIDDWKSLSWSNISNAFFEGQWKSFKKDFGLGVLINFCKEVDVDFNTYESFEEVEPSSSNNKEPFYAHKETLSKEEGIEKQNEILASVHTNPKNTILKSPVGIGKSTGAITNIIGVDWYFNKFISHWEAGTKIGYALPTHKLANELYDKIKAAKSHLNGIVLKGRGVDDMCLKNTLEVDGEKLVELLPKKGLSVFSHMCQKRGTEGNVQSTCEHYESCAYLNQIRNQPENGYDFILFPHAYLTLEQNERFKLKEPDLLIIDEHCLNEFEAHRDIGVKDIHLYLANADNEEKRVLTAVLISNFEYSDIRSYLKGNGIDLKTVKQAKEQAWGKLKNFSSISPQMEEDSLKAGVKGLTKPYGFWRFFQLLEKNWNVEYFNGCVGGRWSYYDQMSKKKSQKVGARLHWKKRQRLFPNVPVLILDADANQDMIESVLEKDFEFHEINLERPNLNITQVITSSFPKSRFTKSEEKGGTGSKDIAKIQALIDLKVSEGKRVVINSYMTLIKPNTFKNCAGIYFGGYIGLDSYKDYDVEIIVGRNEPSVQALEDKGRALYSNEKLEFIIPDENGDLRLPKQDRVITGQNVSCSVSYHPDKRIDALLTSIREDMSLQGIGRVRDVHSTTEKEIFLISNLVLDVPVKKVVAWKDFGVSSGKIVTSKFEEALALTDLSSEIFVYRNDWLSDNFPHLWKDQQSVKNYKKQLKLRKGYFAIDTIYTNNPTLKPLSFKVKGAKTNYSEVYSCLSIKETQKQLEASFGEVEFKFNEDYYKAIEIEVDAAIKQAEIADRKHLKLAYIDYMGKLNLPDTLSTKKAFKASCGPSFKSYDRQYYEDENHYSYA